MPTVGFSQATPTTKSSRLFKTFNDIVVGPMLRLLIRGFKDSFAPSGIDFFVLIFHDTFMKFLQQLQLTLAMYAFM